MNQWKMKMLNEQQEKIFQEWYRTLPKGLDAVEMMKLAFLYGIELCTGKEKSVS